MIEFPPTLIVRLENPGVPRRGFLSCGSPLGDAPGRGKGREVAGRELSKGAGAALVRPVFTRTRAREAVAEMRHVTG